MIGLGNYVSTRQLGEGEAPVGGMGLGLLVAVGVVMWLVWPRKRSV